jgi:hypothetical protein
VRGNIRTISLRANTLRSNATIEEIGQLHAASRDSVQDGNAIEEE